MGGHEKEAMGWRCRVPCAVQGVWVFGRKVQRGTGHGSREPRVGGSKVQRLWGYQRTYLDYPCPVVAPGTARRQSEWTTYHFKSLPV